MRYTAYAPPVRIYRAHHTQPHHTQICRDPIMTCRHTGNSSGWRIQLEIALCFAWGSAHCCTHMSGRMSPHCMCAIQYTSRVHVVLPLLHIITAPDSMHTHSDQGGCATRADEGVRRGRQTRPPRHRRAELRSPPCHCPNVCFGQAGGSPLPVCVFATRTTIACACVNMHTPGTLRCVWMYASHEEIKFGDASPVVRDNRDRIVYDEFEYDQTSIRRIGLLSTHCLSLHCPMFTQAHCTNLMHTSPGYRIPGQISLAVLFGGTTTMSPNDEAIRVACSCSRSLHTAHSCPHALTHTTPHVLSAQAMPSPSTYQ